MIELYITDYSIKNQAFDGIEPKNNNKFIIKIKNCLLSRNLIPLKNKEIKNAYKAYIDGKHYRLVVQEFKPNKFNLIYFRSKNERHSKNISKYKNESQDKILTNYYKVIKFLNENKYVVYRFHNKDESKLYESNL